MTPLEELFEPYPERLSVEQLAELLGIKAPTAYKWLQEGRIPGYKVGTGWLVLREEVREYLEHNRNIPRTPATPAGDAPSPSSPEGTAE